LQCNNPIQVVQIEVDGESKLIANSIPSKGKAELIEKGCFCAMCASHTREVIYIAQNSDYTNKRGMVCPACATGARHYDGIEAERQAALEDLQQIKK